MPYVKPGVRSEFSGWINPLLRMIEERGITAGEINYLVTKICYAALKSTTIHTPLSYDDLNEIIGALEDAKLEFWRRKVVPFEEQAIVRNGDV